MTVMMPKVAKIDAKFFCFYTLALWKLHHANKLLMLAITICNLNLFLDLDLAMMPPVMFQQYKSTIAAGLYLVIFWAGQPGPLHKILAGPTKKQRAGKYYFSLFPIAKCFV